MSDRLGTLVAADPRAVYQVNRGLFLADTFNTLIPAYPLGAGLGRWGMAYSYFGRATGETSPPLWSEIMWTGWVLDGGPLLMGAYAITLLIAMATVTRLLRRRRGELSGWTVAIAAYSAGAVCLTFNCNLFVSQMGMEFWMLNAALFAACRGYDRNFARS